MLLRSLFVLGVFPGINEQLHVGKTFLLTWLSGRLRNLCWKINGKFEPQSAFSVFLGNTWFTFQPHSIVFEQDRNVRGKEGKWEGKEGSQQKEMCVSQDELSGVSMWAVREKQVFSCLFKVLFSTSDFYFCKVCIFLLLRIGRVWMSLQHTYEFWKTDVENIFLEVCDNSVGPRFKIFYLLGDSGSWWEAQRSVMLQVITWVLGLDLTVGALESINQQEYLLIHVCVLLKTVGETRK